LWHEYAAACDGTKSRLAMMMLQYYDDWNNGYLMELLLWLLLLLALSLRHLYIEVEVEREAVEE
jgi:hypothetical protein